MTSIFFILPYTPRLRVWFHQPFNKHTPSTGSLSFSLSATIKQAKNTDFVTTGFFFFPFSFFLPLLLLRFLSVSARLFIFFHVLDTTDLA